MTGGMKEYLDDTFAEGSGHTPGPWEATNEIGAIGQVVAMGAVVDGPSWFVNAPGRPVPDSEVPHNARLIAAAPDLLKAAKEVMAAVPNTDEEYAASLSLQAAIAKAEGDDT